MTLGTPSAQCLKAIETLEFIGFEALKASHEGEFLEYVASTLREYVGSHTLALGLSEPYVHSMAIATPHGVELRTAEPVSGSARHEGRPRPLLSGKGLFCADVSRADASLGPFLEPVSRLDIVSAFIAPLLRNGQWCGQIVFGWSEPVHLGELEQKHLQQLSAHICLSITLFQLYKAHEVDPLTGLLNRAGLRRRWELCANSPRGALIFVDLDDFKVVNDTRGHLAGDNVLRETARIFRKVVGTRGVLARYGGDEIVVLMPDAQLDEANAVRTKLQREFRAAMAGLPEPIPQISVGMASWPEDGVALESLIDRADQRMYQRKRERSGMIRLAGRDTPGALPWSFLQNWLNHGQDGVVLLDPGMRIIYANGAYERLFSCTLDECVGEVPPFIPAGDERVDLNRSIGEQIEREGVWCGYAPLGGAAGEGDVAPVRITRVLDAEERVAGYLAIVSGAVNKVSQQPR